MDTTGRFEALLEKLRQRGQEDLAAELEGIIRALGQQPVPEPPGRVMTTSQAAAMLGVRSINTVKRWAREGELEGFRRGGRILVSCASVERMRHNPAVPRQREQERQLEEALAMLDAEEGRT